MVSLDFPDADVEAAFDAWFVEEGFDQFALNQSGAGFEKIEVTMTSPQHLAGITLTGAD